MTVANGVCGFLALAVVGGLWLGDTNDGPGLDHDQLVAALWLYGIGMVFDVLDGPVARWRGSSGLGPVLDTICDTISFGLLPALLFVASTHGEAAWRGPVLIAAVLYVALTMLRLARHTKYEADEHAAAKLAGREPVRAPFSGMPSPVGGNCVLAIVVLAPPPALAVVVVSVVALLLIADIPYPDNSAVGGAFVAALLAASFLALAGVISLDVPSAAALIGLLPIAIVRVLASWGRALRSVVPSGAWGGKR
jgi:CDP-diacylglycerol--serine O-phosphatidyltransferase